MIPSQMTEEKENFLNWIPEKISIENGEAVCHWLDAGDVPFSDPFFDETLARCRMKRRFRQTSLEKLAQESLAVTGLPPAAIIFHTSRCGSTLFSQLLCLDEKNIVLSEVPLLNQALHDPSVQSDELFCQLLRLYSRPRSGETRLFVKTDSWHIFYAERLRRLFPETPFILLYREPEGLLASQFRRRGMHMIPGMVKMEPFGIEKFEPEKITVNQYGAAVLMAYYHAFIGWLRKDNHSIGVDYASGYPQAYIQVMERLGIGLDAQALEAIHHRCSFHSKNPQENFSEKRTMLPPEIDLLPLQQLYRELKALSAEQHETPAFS